MAIELLLLTTVAISALKPGVATLAQRRRGPLDAMHLADTPLPAPSAELDSLLERASAALDRAH